MMRAAQVGFSIMEAEDSDSEVVLEKIAVLIWESYPQLLDMLDNFLLWQVIPDPCLTIFAVGSGYHARSLSASAFSVIHLCMVVLAWGPWAAT